MSIKKSARVFNVILISFVILSCTNQNKQIDSANNSYKGIIDRIEENHVVIETYDKRILKLPYNDNKNSILKEGNCVIIKEDEIFFDKESTSKAKKDADNLFVHLTEKDY